MSNANKDLRKRIEFLQKHYETLHYSQMEPLDPVKRLAMHLAAQDSELLSHLQENFFSLEERATFKGASEAMQELLDLIDLEETSQEEFTIADIVKYMENGDLNVSYAYFNKEDKHFLRYNLGGDFVGRFEVDGEPLAANILQEIANHLNKQAFLSDGEAFHKGVTFSSVKKAIVKENQSLIEYYNENVDELADLMCENVPDYLRFHGFYYDINGNIGILYLSTDNTVKTYIID